MATARAERASVGVYLNSWSAFSNARMVDTIRDDKRRPFSADDRKTYHGF